MSVSRSRCEIGPVDEAIDRLRTELHHLPVEQVDEFAAWLRNPDVPGPTPLHFFLCHPTSGRDELFAALVRAGVNVDAVDGEGLTLLHRVATLDAACDPMGLAQTLLRLGAHRDVRDPRGRTPFDLACTAGRDEIARLLRS